MDKQIVTIFQKNQILKEIYAQQLVLVIQSTIFTRTNYLMRDTFWKLRWHKVKELLGERLNKSLSQMYSNLLIVHLFQIQKSFIKIRLKSVQKKAKDCKSQIKIIVMNKLPYLKNEMIRNNNQIVQLQKILFKLHFHPKELVKYFVIWQNISNKRNLENILNYFDKENEKNDFLFKQQIMQQMLNIIDKQIQRKKIDAIDSLSRVMPKKYTVLQQIINRKEEQKQEYDKYDKNSLLLVGWNRIIKQTLKEQDQELNRQKYISQIYFNSFMNMKNAWQRWVVQSKKQNNKKVENVKRFSLLIRQKVLKSKRNVFNFMHIQQNYMRSNIELIKKLLQLKFLKKVQFRIMSQTFIQIKRYNCNPSIYYSSNQSQQQKNSLIIFKHSLINVQKYILQQLKNSFTKISIYANNYYQQDYDLQREINQNHITTLSIVSNSLHFKFLKMDQRFIDKKRKGIISKYLRKKMFIHFKDVSHAFSIWKSCIIKFSMKERVFLLKQNQRIENEKDQLIQRFEQLQNENQELQSIYQQIHTSHNTPSVRSNRKIVSFDNNVEQFNLNSEFLDIEQAKQEEYSLNYVEQIENQNIQLKNQLENQSLQKKKLKMEYERKQQQIQQSNFHLQAFALQSNDLYGK